MRRALGRCPAILVWIVLATAAGWPSRSASAGQAPDEKRLRAECEYGIAQALAGADSAAEAAFVSLLSHSPGDARALNNLGNLSLFRGDLDVAIEYYQQGREADSLDAGIILNEATALLLRGDGNEAQARAAEGVRMAGGLREAALLLGLKPPEARAETPKAGDRAYIRKDEVLSLLKAAAAGVPADSLRSKSGKPGPGPSRLRKRRPTWRSAGARGAEGTDVTAVVYWKQ